MVTLTNGVTEVFTSKVFDTIDFEWQEGATATLTLYDESGTAITGASSLPMPQVTGTTGRDTLYRCEVPHTVTLPAGTEGEALVTATNVVGKVGEKRIAVRYVD